MARKKVRRSPRRSHRRVHHRVRAQKGPVARGSSISTNIRIVLNNLIIFFILFLISLILYGVIQLEILHDLFFIFMLGFGFISLAFLLTLVVFLFLRLLKKRR